MLRSSISAKQRSGGSHRIRDDITQMERRMQSLGRYLDLDIDVQKDLSLDESSEISSLVSSDSKSSVHSAPRALNSVQCENKDRGTFKDREHRQVAAPVGDMAILFPFTMKASNARAANRDRTKAFDAAMQNIFSLTLSCNDNSSVESDLTVPDQELESHEKWTSETNGGFENDSSSRKFRASLPEGIRKKIRRGRRRTEREIETLAQPMPRITFGSRSPSCSGRQSPASRRGQSPRDRRLERAESRWSVHSSPNGNNSVDEILRTPKRYNDVDSSVEIDAEGEISLKHSPGIEDKKKTKSAVALLRSPKAHKCKCDDGTPTTALLTPSPKSSSEAKENSKIRAWPGFDPPSLLQD